MSDKLIYSFICDTNTQTNGGNKEVSIEGSKLISALAHKYDIPVTWLIEPISFSPIAGLINDGHIDHGDELVIFIDQALVFERDNFFPSSKAEEAVILRKKLPDLIRNQYDRVNSILPWAELKVLATNIRSPIFVETATNLGANGIWGYKWSYLDEMKVINTTCPWGFFYISTEHDGIPSSHMHGLVGAQFSSLDLTSSYYTENPSIFSPIPSYLHRSGLCRVDNYRYAKDLLGEYLNNLGWNRFLTFVQCQSARDLEYDSYITYGKDTIRDIVNIIEFFFNEVRSNSQIEVMSLPQAIEEYRREFSYTEPCCLAFDGILTSQDEIDYFIAPKPKNRPPYPLTFFYYDHECQLIFREGQILPVEVKNYLYPPLDSRYYIEKDIPSVISFRPARDRDRLIMEFEIESTKKMPFGLAIWDDHTPFRLVSTNARFVKWIGTYLLFVRANLREGMNLIEITLSI